MKPVKHLNLLILLAVFTATASSVSEAGESYYRWSDEWGNPVLSDRLPPKGTDYEVVNSGPSLARRVNSAEGVAPAKVDPPVEKTVEKKVGEIDSDKVETIEKNPEYCKRAQDNLHALNTSARIRMRDKNGEPYLMGQEEKEAMIKDAQDVIEMHCD